MNSPDYIEWWSHSISKKENKMNLEDGHLKEGPGTRTHTPLFPSLSSQDTLLTLLVGSRRPSPLKSHTVAVTDSPSLAGWLKGTAPRVPKPLTSRCLRSWVAFASDLTALYWLMLRSKDFKQAVESMPRRRPVSSHSHPLATASSWSRAFFDFLRSRRFGSGCFRFRSASGSLRAASGNSACDWRGLGRGSRLLWERGGGGGEPRSSPLSAERPREGPRRRGISRDTRVQLNLWRGCGAHGVGARRGLWLRGRPRRRRCGAWCSCASASARTRPLP